MPRLRGALLVLTMLAAVAGCGSSGPVSLSGDAQSPTQAQNRAAALLDRVYLAGSVRTRSPESLPTSPAGDFVTQARRFTVLGTAASVVDRLRKAPPPGLSSVAGVGTSRSASFRPTGRDNSGMQAVDVVATDAGRGRVSVQVRADVGWVAARTDLETVPGAVTSARLGIAFGDDPDPGSAAQRSVSPREWAVLSAALNSLPTTSRSEYALCVDPEIALVQLRTQYGGHDALFDIEVGGCDEVDAEVDGVEQPLLDRDGPVVRAVASILHVSLPSR